MSNRDDVQEAKLVEKFAFLAKSGTMERLNKHSRRLGIDNGELLRRCLMAFLGRLDKQASPCQKEE